MFNADDMRRACRLCLEGARLEGCSEREREHIREGGWYSEAVMAFVVTHKVAEMEAGAENGMILDVDNPIHWNELSAARIRDAHTLGVVVNINQMHWVSFRYDSLAIWLLDSQHAGPEEYSFADFQTFLKEHPNAFCLRRTA